MAGFFLGRPDVFPEGTEVSARRRPDANQSQIPVTAGVGPVDEVTTADSDGVRFDDLEPLTPYVATATISGRFVWVFFISDDDVDEVFVLPDDPELEEIGSVTVPYSGQIAASVQVDITAMDAHANLTGFGVTPAGTVPVSDSDYWDVYGVVKRGKRPFDRGEILDTFDDVDPGESTPPAIYKRFPLTTDGLAGSPEGGSLSAANDVYGGNRLIWRGDFLVPDSTEVTVKYTVGEANGAQGSVRAIPKLIDKFNFLHVSVRHAVTPATLRVAVVNNDITTNGPAVNLPSNTAGDVRWLKVIQTGNNVVGEVWDADPFTADAGLHRIAQTATYVLTGADATNYGGGTYGFPGTSLVVQTGAGALAWRLDDLRIHSGTRIPAPIVVTRRSTKVHSFTDPVTGLPEIGFNRRGETMVAGRYWEIADYYNTGASDVGGEPFDFFARRVSPGDVIGLRLVKVGNPPPLVNPVLKATWIER